MDLLSALVGETRHDPLLNPFTWSGLSLNGTPLYGYPLVSQTIAGDKEVTPDTFAGYVNHAYKESGPVFACEYVRLSVFSEARLMYQRLDEGRPGDLFNGSALDVVRRPWPGGTTGDLLSRGLLHADFAGNAFIRRNVDRLSLLRPDWVDVVLGTETDLPPVQDPDAEIIGYLYHPGGRLSQNEPIPYLVDEVAHFAPIPDPLANYRGMSWLTPVVREVVGDKAATNHKNKFYENGATPNMVVKGQWTDPDQMRKWLKIFEEQYGGARNAYKTLGLGQGMDATVVGRDFQQMDFKSVQGAAETRIAAASGVGAVVAQLSEGLQGSSLNSGNYQAARRRTGDVLFRPLWRQFCGSVEHLVPPPTRDGDARLWYDDHDIDFLQEDAADEAAIRKEDALTIESLIRGGFTPVSARDAVLSNNFAALEHTGLISVQLQAPGSTESVSVPAESAAALLAAGWRHVHKEPTDE